ncbi:MAG TPA: hypothetical protein VK194_03355 [Candidatus Deferrimicrobium sp.]|nr:hypothetical protein [Candidatus Deferrimicrobium sp.]
MTFTTAGGSDCTCAHPLACDHGCHGRHCDPTEHVCSLEFLPDDGGLTPWGCGDCTPGGRMPHLVGCPEAMQVDASVASGPVTPGPVASV